MCHSHDRTSGSGQRVPSSRAFIGPVLATNQYYFFEPLEDGVEKFGGTPVEHAKRISTDKQPQVGKWSELVKGRRATLESMPLAISEILAVYKYLQSKLSSGSIIEDFDEWEPGRGNYLAFELRKR